MISCSKNSREKYLDMEKACQSLSSPSSSKWLVLRVIIREKEYRRWSGRDMQDHKGFVRHARKEFWFDLIISGWQTFSVMSQAGSTFRPYGPCPIWAEVSLLLSQWESSLWQYRKEWMWLWPLKLYSRALKFEFHIIFNFNKTFFFFWFLSTT